ncbi:sorting nexin 17, partial [Chelydra serpentina]
EGGWGQLSRSGKSPGPLAAGSERCFSLAVMRKLQEFELPYVSVTSLRNPDYKIILRKSYWDSSYDDDVMEQRVGLDLLYAQ